MEIFESKTQSYKKWKNMFDHLKREKNKGQTVCMGWHTYSVFKEWFEGNGYHLLPTEWNMTNKVLNSNETEWNPDTVLMAPKWVIDIVRHEDGLAPKSGMIGVYVEKNGKFYTVVKNHRVGYFDSAEECKEAYLTIKRAIVNSERIRLNHIDKRIYPALMNRFMSRLPDMEEGAKVSSPYYGEHHR